MREGADQAAVFLAGVLAKAAATLAAVALNPFVEVAQEGDRRAPLQLARSRSVSLPRLIRRASSYANVFLPFPTAKTVGKVGVPAIWLICEFINSQLHQMEW